MERFQVQTVPTTYVVAPDGVVVLSKTGLVSLKDLRAAVERARLTGS